MQFDYDVFLSFAYEDRDKAKVLHERLERRGFTVFFSDDHRRREIGASGWQTKIHSSIEESQHFLLYCSPHVENSAWVADECNRFHDLCHLPDANNRRMYVIVDVAEHCRFIPSHFKPVLQPTEDWEEEVLASIAKKKIEDLMREVAIVRDDAGKSRTLASRAFDLYRHRGFWRPFAEPSHGHPAEVHLFICGRDTAQHREGGRGVGGRTNIDKWDYQTALDVSRYFSRWFPQVSLQIEDPVSKRSSLPVDLLEAEEMLAALRNNDCIIVGSPDVSDFAELVLAQWHGVAPYVEQHEKPSGFIILKEKVAGESAFYRRRQGEHGEGVLEVTPEGEPTLFGTHIDFETRSGTTHGVLVMVDNPWCDEGVRRKILILSGFSGPATNALAKFLTDDTYLDEFHRFDNDYAATTSNVEALIEVTFAIGDDYAERDSRALSEEPAGVKYVSIVDLGAAPPPRRRH